MKALSVTTVPIFSSLLLSNNHGVVQPANAAQTTGEAIRRSAANIPGYGQADVFYPSSFIGRWKATRVIVSLPAGGVSESYFPLTMTSSNLLQEMLPLTITYDVRFITVDGDISFGGSSSSSSSSSNNGVVIADRQFNEESLYNAFQNAIIAKIEMNNTTPSTVQYQKQPPFIQTISWSPSNPNVLSSNYNDGSSKEIKVTKRAAELDVTNGIISSSEYRRVTTVRGGNYNNSNKTTGGMAPSGIPTISASRVLNKWKISNDGNSGSDTIEGIEIVYADGVVGDPMSAGIGGVGGGGQPAGQQQSNSKSRLRLERI